MSASTATEGWAVSDDQNGLMANTVASTRRRAIITWLVAVAKVAQHAPDYSDEEVEYLWQRYGTNPNRASVHKVKITVV